MLKSADSSLSVRIEQPLIGVITQEDGQEMVRYFFDDAPTSRQVSQDAQRLAGAWSDLNWDDLVATLEHIRHDTPPTAPLTL